MAEITRILEYHHFNYWAFATVFPISDGKHLVRLQLPSADYDVSILRDYNINPIKQAFDQQKWIRDVFYSRPITLVDKYNNSIRCLVYNSILSKCNNHMILNINNFKIPVDVIVKTPDITRIAIDGMINEFNHQESFFYSRLGSFIQQGLRSANI